MSLARKTQGEFKDSTHRFGGTIVHVNKNLASVTISRGSFVVYRVYWDSSFNIARMINGNTNSELKNWRGVSLFRFLYALDVGIERESLDMIENVPARSMLAQWALASQSYRDALVCGFLERNFQFSSTEGRVIESESDVSARVIGHWEKDSDLYFLGVHFRLNNGGCGVYDTVKHLHESWFGTEWKHPDPPARVSENPVSPSPKSLVHAIPKNPAEVMADKKVEKVAKDIVKALEESDDFFIERSFHPEVAARVQSVLVRDGFIVTLNQKEGSTVLRVACL